MSSPPSPDSAESRGLLALLGAFTIWGLLPLYLRALTAVPAGQIMAYRLVLCCVVVLAALAARGELAEVRAALRSRDTRMRLVTSALLISCNWLFYVWAIQNGRVIESSLGYFINPLVNVLLGVAVLRERLTRVQWCAVALAASGVAYLTWQAGSLPWIALVLALSFGSYGLVRKTVAASAMVGLGTETLLLTPFGVAYLVYCEASGHGVLARLPAVPLVFLLLSGAATAIPLGLFTFGARRVRYSTVGLVQYIGPSIQLALGIVVFGESFSATRAIGFAMIWTALAIYAGQGLLRRAVLSSLAIGLVLAGGPARAHANGAFPDSLAVLLPEDQPDRIYVATNFGLVRSDDAGATWGVVCEEAIGTLTTLYSVGGAPSDRVLAITLDGLVVSNDDGCSWKLTPPPPVYPSDAFVDPADPDHVIAVAEAGRSAKSNALQGIFVSHDGAASFDRTPLYTADEGYNFTGIEIARTDPSTIYAALYEYLEGHGSVLLRSHDGGVHFGMVDLTGTLAQKLARILAVDPEDPERVYLRAYDSTPQEQLAIYDGTSDEVQPSLQLEHRMSAFLRRSDGALIVGTREEGAKISSDGGKTWQRWAGAPHLRGLGERQGRLYAVADDLVDGYALAVSDDNGDSWQPLLHYADITGPYQCANVPLICEQPWSGVLMRLDGGPEDPLPPISGEDASTNRDAGTRDAGIDKAGGEGCGCNIIGGAARRSSDVLVVVFVVLFVVGSRRRARARARPSLRDRDSST
jgi:chloramphenicol-sensitive protein RarD